jgi:3-dehydroquinate synthase
MERIRISLGLRSYDVLVQTGGLNGLGLWVKSFSLNNRILVVADTNTANLFGQAAIENLQAAGFVAVLAIVPAGESAKSIDQADCLYEQAIQSGLDRNSPILALGGGVVGDLSGFVAATFLRGVPFLQVPTTLLSQVDSSVGGKVAVNHRLGKNLIGAFYQPMGVMIDPQTLNSLPEREFASGMAEVIKYGLIADADFLSTLSMDMVAVRERAPAFLARLIAHCCKMKAAVVERDEQDLGERILLNFGHTAGHAIEAAGDFHTYTHGEGVGLGMLVATRLSEIEGLLPENTTEHVRNLLANYRLPVQAENLNPDELIRRMGTDKKREAGKLRWVLLDSIGRAVTRNGISEESVRESLRAVL